MAERPYLNATPTLRTIGIPSKLILKAVGGLVGFIGGLGVQQMDERRPDVNKRNPSSYGGAMIFLIVVPEFVTRISSTKMGYYLYKGLKNPYSSELKGKYIPIYAVAVIGAQVWLQHSSYQIRIVGFIIRFIGNC